MAIFLTNEQETEIDLAWQELAREQLNPLVGERLDGHTYSAMKFLAKNIGRELSHRFYYYLNSDEEIEVTIGVDDSFGIVAGWRPIKSPPPLVLQETEDDGDPRFREEAS